MGEYSLVQTQQMKTVWSKLIILQIPGRSRWWLLIGLAVIIVNGCAGTQSRSIPTRADSSDVQAQVHPGSQSATTANGIGGRVEHRLRSKVRQWEGTPHRMGGSTRRGVDCSGFVHRLYQDFFGQQIPRSTALLVKSGRPISKKQLRTGDLVFFKVPNKGRHVGIYLSRSEFAHASTSNGVTISNIEDHFWRRYYWTARRYRSAPN
jgi:cell wall-associated NlpC family hydrolase